MLKATLVALLGLVSLASAEIVINTPLTSFLRPKAFLRGFTNPSDENSAVTWGECKSDGGFKVDFGNTYSVPAVPVKGSNVQLKLAGVFTDDA